MFARSRMTSEMLVCWMVLAGVLRAESPADAPSSSPASGVVAVATEPSSPRNPTELRAAVRTALHRESSSTGPEQVAAIHDLLALYRELAQSGRLERDERIQLRGTIRSRLTNVSRRISRQLTKAPVPKVAVPKVAVPKVAVKGPRLPEEKAEVLAQQVGAAPVNLAAVAPDDQPDLMVALAELVRHVIAAENWDEQPAAARRLGGQQIAAQQVAAGPMAGPGMGPGGAGGLPKDLGADLVELIQQTIAPDTWEVNGGQGTIVYFGPLQAIVVRQTDEVHDNLNGLIRDLRK